MEKQVTGKEAVKNMEYLVKLLHKEWECSGRKKAEVAISFEEAGKIKEKLARQINCKQQMAENEELTFKQCMDMSKENFIILRLVKKIKKAEEKANKKGLDLEFSVELDKEEFKLLQSILSE